MKICVNDFVKTFIVPSQQLIISDGKATIKCLAKHLPEGYYGDLIVSSIMSRHDIDYGDNIEILACDL